MNRSSGPSYRRLRVAPPPPPKAHFVQRWWGKASLLLLGIVLLSLSFAPFDQFYLAWVALVPWLVVLRWCRSGWRAFAWSWLAGVGFFAANMWWLVWVTGPGMLALMALLGLYWGAAGAIICGSGLLAPAAAPVGAGPAQPRPRVPGRPLLSVALIAGVWVALEWVRGSWPWGGLPWLYLGHTQSPVLHLCQIADITGVYGISAWLAAVNAWAALFVLNRLKIEPLGPAAAAIIVLLLIVAGYGFYRFGQHARQPGPQVLVVQPNYPQDNSGEKGAGFDQILRFHVEQTRRALVQSPGTNLVVWSETMMPPLNPSAMEHVRDERIPSQLAAAQIEHLASRFNTAFLVGGMNWENWQRRRDGWLPTEERNSAYFFVPGGGPPTLRYDKVHLVPFGEFLPFKNSFPPLYHLFLLFSPYPPDYTWLTGGAPDALTVFPLKSDWRFVSPICFEDIDAALVRRMFKPASSGAGKRADFIVNVTNDGWFKYNQMPQHLQAALFRSIENRVPTARSVNTGVSGFIDSMGQTSGLVPAGAEGVSVARLSLDRRLTFYTRFGDVFAYLCAGVTLLLAIVSIFRRWKNLPPKQGAQA